ncbi:unnamed protein product [Absidia cylindrospora]
MSHILMNPTVQDSAISTMTNGSQATTGNAAATHDSSTASATAGNKQTRQRHGHHHKKKDQGDKKDQDKKPNGSSIHHEDKRRRNQTIRVIRLPHWKAMLTDRPLLLPTIKPRKHQQELRPPLLLLHPMMRVMILMMMPVLFVPNLLLHILFRLVTIVPVIMCSTPSDTLWNQELCLL